MHTLLDLVFIQRLNCEVVNDRKGFLGPVQGLFWVPRAIPANP